MVKRIFIYPKDVMQITGRSESYCRNLIKTIKDVHDKEKHQLVTIDEFCDYMGIEVSKVEAFVK